MQTITKPRGLAKIWREVKRPFRKIVERMERYPLAPVSLTLPFYSPTDFTSDEIFQELKPLGNFSFLPNSGNMGDIVIAMAEYQFFEKHRLKYKVFRDQFFQENLVYGGGGLFVRNWKNEYQWILELFQNKYLKKIVILPSSFHDCPDLLEIIDDRFTMFCREEKSHNYLLSSGVKGKIILSHDMALYLSEDLPKVTPRFHSKFRNVYQQIKASAPKLTQLEGYAIAYFLRTDSEANADWSNIGVQSTLDLSLCICSDSRDPEEVAFYGKLFLAGIDMADIVVTDRLHVGIGAMLMGKKVFLLDNSYGKVSGVYERSMKQFPRVQFVDDVRNLPGVIKQTVAAGIVRQTTNLENLTKIGEVLA